MAVYDSGSSKTFAVYQNGNLAPKATVYDHDTGTWGEFSTVGSNPLTDDNHGAPALCKTSDGTLHVFWGSHGTPQKYAKSTNSLDASNWTQQPDIGSEVTYPQPIVTSTDDIYLWLRQQMPNEQRPQTVFKSTDGGDSWTDIGPIVDFGTQARIYAGDVTRDGTDMHVTWVWNDRTAGGRYNVYHAILDSTDDSLRAIDGTSLATPIDKAAADNNCLVFDSVAASEETNTPRVEVDGSGNPHLVYLRDDSGTWTHTYQHWTGTAWSQQLNITASNHAFSHPEIVLNSAADITAYLTVRPTGSSEYGGDIEQWSYDGVAWTRDRIILQASDVEYPLNGPQIPLDAVPEFGLLFSENSLDFSNGDLDVFAYGDTGFVKR